MQLTKALILIIKINFIKHRSCPPVLKETLKSSNIYQRKGEYFIFLVVFFFFYQCFLSQTVTIHRTTEEGLVRTIFLPIYYFHLLRNFRTFICNFPYEMTAFSALHAITRMLLEDIYPPQGIGILLNANCSLFYDLMLDLFTAI